MSREFAMDGIPNARLVLSGVKGNVKLDINQFQDEGLRSDFDLEVIVFGTDEDLRRIDVFKEKDSIKILGDWGNFENELRIITHNPYYYYPEILEAVDIGGNLNINGFQDISIVTAGTCIAEIGCIANFSCVAGGKSIVHVGAVNNSIGRLEAAGNAQIVIERLISEGGFMQAVENGQIKVSINLAEGVETKTADWGIITTGKNGKSTVYGAITARLADKALTMARKCNINRGIRMA